MTFPKKNKRAVKTTVAGQLAKVIEEAVEVARAVVAYTLRPTVENAEHLGEECLDLMLATEALFCKIPAASQLRSVEIVQDKGEERGDWL